MPALVHVYNCTKNATTGYSPYFLLYESESRYFILNVVSRKITRNHHHVNIIIWSSLGQGLGIPTGEQKSFKATGKHNGLYDKGCKGGELGIGDLVLVRSTAWMGRKYSRQLVGPRISGSRSAHF